MRKPIVFTVIFHILGIQGFGILSIIRDGRTQKTHHASSSLMTSPSDMSYPIHHTAIKTRNITLAIQFYGLLGFDLRTKFRAGPARAAWLQQNGISQTGTILELIEVPSHMLSEPDGMKCRALDLLQRQDLLGSNHFALDISSFIEAEDGMSSLSDWMDFLNEKSVKAFGKNLRIALKPRQQLIGNSVYELAFLYDADGALVELLHKQKDLEQHIDSGWEPWDGTGFSGPQ